LFGRALVLHIITVFVILARSVLLLPFETGLLIYSLSLRLPGFLCLLRSFAMRCVVKRCDTPVTFYLSRDRKSGW